MNVKEVFQRCLKDLRLGEFPCGDGGWRNDVTWESDLHEVFADDANLFTNECLLELTESLPFQKDLKWSLDAKTLVKETINDPKRKKGNVYRKFKKLRLIDKNIETVDASIAKFEKLEELTLSANAIERFDSRFLPRSLQVLELCGNKICRCEFLEHLPSLHHLGLSHNDISSVSYFIKIHCWNSLLSLDLSSNYLEDMKTTVKALETMAKLRILRLHGNPLYLFMGYRGYLIDSLKSLTNLDDILISSEEHHEFKELVETKNMPLHSSVINVHLDNFQSASLQEPSDSNSNEYPRSFQKYHIEFNYEKGYRYLTEGESSRDGKSSDESEAKSRLVVSKEFALNEASEFDSNVHLFSTKLKELSDFLSQTLEIRLVQNTIIMSNEPKTDDSGIQNENSNTTSNGKSTPVSAALKKSASKLSTPKAKDTDSGSKGKKKGNSTKTDLYEWARSQQTIGLFTIDVRSLLKGESAFETRASFKTLQGVPNACTTSAQSKLPKIEIESAALKSSAKAASQPSSRGAKTATQTTSRNAKAATKPSSQPVVVSKEQLDTTAQPIEILNEDISPSVRLEMKVLRWNSSNDARDWTEKYGGLY